MSRIKHSLPLTVAFAVALPCAAASAKPPDQPQPSTPTTGTPTPGTGTTTPTPGTGTTTPATDDLTDEEIISYLEVYNDVGLDNNRKNRKSMKDKRVKKFAETRIKHANGAKKRLTTMRTRNKFKPKRSGDVTNYETTVVEAYKDLDSTKKGREFDATYIDDEIEVMTNMVDTIDRVLLPNVDLPELRDELNTVRTEVNSDIQEARTIRDNLREQQPVT
ncbi:DUF4142 domain-containing protein [Nannocystis radixulma]|uniref:DUF4142 domain-containing protein n=1 Tax=Nannocystis radixulma TaxID=2995305 RepID=A0ABT5B522_9BACT|nr:DUF4142 domain-containing protein [Nannocystis radixulma]MDC0668573.1 DUF4142 domain-containing protein [Nannocystis radixulma]